MESDFSERKSAEQPMSLDDKKFMQKMKQGIRQGNDGHYEMPLPFRDEEPRMSNNRSLAMHRLAKLKTRLENDEQYRNDYVAFMNDLIEKKYAERVPEQQLPTSNSRIWYIPHHGVYHPKKPANYGLMQIADDHEEFGAEAASFARDDFYVDDGLKSVNLVSEAVSLIKGTKDLCARGGLRLHKFVSNSREVMESIPPNERASGIKNLDMRKANLPVERALGVEWCVESDTFQLRVILQNKPPPDAEFYPPLVPYTTQ